MADREKQLETFRRMYAMGNIPEITVRQKMAKFNISDDEIDAFFVAIHAKDSGAAPPPAVCEVGTTLLTQVISPPPTSECSPNRFVGPVDRAGLVGLVW